MFLFVFLLSLSTIVCMSFCEYNARHCASMYSISYMHKLYDYMRFFPRIKPKFLHFFTELRCVLSKL